MRNKKQQKGLLLSLKSKTFKAGGYSLAAIAIVIVIAVVINILAAALPETVTQLDNTSNQLFTISEQTEQLTASLESDVTIYWIVRDGYEDSTIDQLLKRYEALSSHINVEKIDPDVYPSFTTQYTSSVTDNSIVVESESRSRYVDYYDIYLYDYDYYTYMYYGTYDVSFDGESAITSAIDYVINEELPKVYMLTGHGESELTTTFSSAVEKENIEMESLSLLTAETVPEDASCLIINAPTSDISAQEKEVIAEYLKAGGKMLLITAPLQDTELTNIEELMSDYGVSLAEGIAIEGDTDYCAWGMPYYMLPTVNSHTITDPLVNGGYRVLLPLAQGLMVADELPENVSVTELLTTSDSSFSKIAGYNLTTYDKEDGDIDGPFALAVAVTEQIDDDTQTQIVWISSSAITDDEANEMVSGGNQDLFLNSLDWMCEKSESSISIHSKSLSQEYLTINSSLSSFLSILMIGIIPILFIAIGIYVWIRRKRR